MHGMSLLKSGSPGFGQPDPLPQIQAVELVQLGGKVEEPTQDVKQQNQIKVVVGALETCIQLYNIPPLSRL
jgi:hypothetical protein